MSMADIILSRNIIKVSLLRKSTTQNIFVAKHKIRAETVQKH